MKRSARALFCSVFLLTSTRAGATPEVGVEVVDLWPLNASVGADLLARNTKHNSVQLIMHYVTQESPGHCGAASAVMVLNSCMETAPAHAKSPGYHYFTQDNFFSPAVSAILTSDQVRAHGFTLPQLAQALETWGTRTELFYAPANDHGVFKYRLAEALANGDYVIVNFSRSSLCQAGTGHHSPVAAYDVETDRFLILDVARYKEPAFWVTSRDLWRAVTTSDDAGRPRGAIIVPGKSEGVPTNIRPDISR